MLDLATPLGVVCTVSYADDCRDGDDDDDDGGTTQLSAETDGYLAVFSRQRRALSSSSSRNLPPASPPRRCPWTLVVNPGRRINITWRLSPALVRFPPPGSSLPLDARLSPDVQEDDCSPKLTFIEAGHAPVHWSCRQQDHLSTQLRSTQVRITGTASQLWTPEGLFSRGEQNGEPKSEG